MRQFVHAPGNGELGLNVSGNIAPSAGGATMRLPEPGEDWPFGTHYVLIPSPAEMRRLLGPPQESVRRARSSVYFAGLPNRARARLPLGMHDRFEEFIFADGQLHAADATGHARHMPAHLKIIRLSEVTIGAGETWDVSSSHSVWANLHFREELYVHVRIDRLIVAPGAKVEVHGNVLVLECGEIHMHGQASGDNRNAIDGFEISILPTRHPAYSQFRSTPGLEGKAGTHGGKGAHSKATKLIGTPFGPRLLRFSSNMDGAPGSNGTDSGNGITGQNGGMAMLADIRLGALIGFPPSSLRVVAQAGPGLPGGSGGDGGNGGAGGNGADGIDSQEGVIHGGIGAPGGDGGNGGNGGRGGSGGLSANVFLQARAADAECFALFSKESIGGLGGAAGTSGGPGTAGIPGHMADESAIAALHPAVSGRSGLAGLSGKSRSGPSIHLFTAPSE